MSERQQSNPIKGCLAVAVVLIVLLGGGALLAMSLLNEAPPEDATATSTDPIDTSPNTANTTNTNTADPTRTPVTPPVTTVTPANNAVTVGVAYGTEKKAWLRWALERFQQDPSSAGITIDLIPMGSVEGAHAILDGDQRIDVWSPASDLYVDVFVTRWQANRGTSPFRSRNALALSPMVFVMWAERAAEFDRVFGSLTFKTLSEALAKTGGWAEIAEKPEWGLFKFGHTHPNQSNSGLMTLVLMAYIHYNKERDLELSDILAAEFQTWMKATENGVAGLIHSTGTMMNDMLLKGPSSYDVVCVYENLALNSVGKAEGRWGSLAVRYPAINMWNDNPYYILDTPWTDGAERKAAETFRDFLLRKDIQEEALAYGFRPADPDIPITGPNSPFTKHKRYGFQIAINRIAQAPKAEVLENLLMSWQRAVGR